MAKTFKAADARILNNRFEERWIVEFSDGMVSSPNNGGFNNGSGDINKVIDGAIAYAAEMIELKYGRVDITFKVYGAVYQPDEYFLSGKFVKGDEVYSW